MSATKSNLPQERTVSDSHPEKQVPDPPASKMPIATPLTAKKSSSPTPIVTKNIARVFPSEPVKSIHQTVQEKPETKTIEPASPQQQDVYIAVMGQTGTGKSTFINQVTGAKLGVGHSLESCTENIQFATTIINGTRVTLIDTPGFDEHGRDDAEILTLISLWLRKAHSQSKLLSGVIYLHRIMDPRMTGASIRSLTMMRKMCGTRTYDKIALGTTMWDKLGPSEPEVGESREKELKEKWWEHIIAGGGKVYRHTNSETSARNIVMDLLPNRSALLGIQSELEQNNIMSTTSAGAYAKEELEKLQALQTGKIFHLQACIEQLQEEQVQSEATKKELTADLETANKFIEKLKTDMETLNMKIEVLQESMVPNVPEVQQRHTFLGRVWGMLAGWEAATR